MSGNLLTGRQRLLFALDAVVLLPAVLVSLAPSYFLFALPVTATALACAIGGLLGASWIGRRPALHVFSHLVGCAWLSLAGGWILFKVWPRPTFTYVVPESFSGPVAVVYGDPNGEPINRDRVIRIPITGLAFVRDELTSFARVRVVRDTGGRLNELSQRDYVDVELQRHHRVCEDRPDKWVELDFFRVGRAPELVDREAQDLIGHAIATIYKHRGIGPIGCGGAETRPR